MYNTAEIPGNATISDEQWEYIIAEGLYTTVGGMHFTDLNGKRIGFTIDQYGFIEIVSEKRIPRKVFTMPSTGVKLSEKRQLEQVR